MVFNCKEYKVSDIALNTPNAMSTGPFGSAISSKFFQEKGVPVIRGGNLSADVTKRMSDVGLVYISEEKAKEFKRSTVKSGDLIFTCWGTINQVGLINDDLIFSEYVISNKQMKLTPDPDKADYLFLYYLFSSPMKQSEILSNGIGAAVPGFNLGQLKNHVVNLPPVSIQKKIASTLNTFDNKIRLNNETNQTLEQITQAIFKSWFVDFEPTKAKIAAREALLADASKENKALTAGQIAKAPSLEEIADAERQAAIQAIGGTGYIVPTEQLETFADLFPNQLVDSELGEIPEGWEASILGQHFDVTMGQSPKGDTYNEKGDGIVFYQGRRDFGFRFPSPRVYTTDPKRFAEAGDTLISVRAPVGDKNMAYERCCLGRGVGGIRHKSDMTSFTYAFISVIEHKLGESGSDGTVFSSINKNELNKVPFVAPSPKLIEIFETLVKPMNEQVKVNSNQINALEELRDSLLPKLLSGEITLSNDQKDAVSA